MKTIATIILLAFTTPAFCQEPVQSKQEQVNQFMVYRAQQQIRLRAVKDEIKANRQAKAQNLSPAKPAE